MVPAAPCAGRRDATSTARGTGYPPGRKTPRRNVKTWRLRRPLHVGSGTGRRRSEEWPRDSPGRRKGLRTSSRQRTRLTGAITLSRTTQEGGSEDPDRERPQPSRVDCSAGPGNSFHSSPSGKRPPAFGCAPPHCLKKNASPPFRYMSWSRRAESGCMGRTRKPLSPSTIAHAMSRKSTSSTGPRSGSKEMKRTWELISLRWVMPLTWAASSTGTPCGGTSLPP